MISLNKKNRLALLYLFLFVVSAHFSNFFYNVYYVIKNNYQSRLNYHYGYCEKESYGYIDYLYKKYNFENNIKIINAEQYPTSEWFFFDLNKNMDEDYTILLNNNKKIDLNNFEIIHNFENCFLLKKIK